MKTISPCSSSTDMSVFFGSVNYGPHFAIKSNPDLSVEDGLEEIYERCRESLKPHSIGERQRQNMSGFTCPRLWSMEKWTPIMKLHASLPLHWQSLGPKHLSSNGFSQYQAFGGGSQFQSSSLGPAALCRLVTNSRPSVGNPIPFSCMQSCLRLPTTLIIQARRIAWNDRISTSMSLESQKLLPRDRPHLIIGIRPR